MKEINENNINLANKMWFEDLKNIDRRLEEICNVYVTDRIRKIAVQLSAFDGRGLEKYRLFKVKEATILSIQGYMSGEEKEDLLAQYGISYEELPRLIQEQEEYDKVFAEYEKITKSFTTDEEIVALDAKKVELKNKIVSNNLYIIEEIMKNNINEHIIDRNKVFNNAITGLVKAVDDYNSKLNIPFYDFAKSYIQNEITKSSVISVAREWNKFKVESSMNETVELKPINTSVCNQLLGLKIQGVELTYISQMPDFIGLDFVEASNDLTRIIAEINTQLTNGEENELKIKRVLAEKLHYDVNVELINNIITIFKTNQNKRTF